MADYLDFFNEYVMGSIQMLMGFFFLSKFLQKKIKFYEYFMFEIFFVIIIRIIPSGSIAEFLAYLLLLVISGIFVCHAQWKSVILYAVLIVEVMQQTYGIVNSLLSMLYPIVFPYHKEFVGVGFMLLGNIALLFAAVCYFIAYRYFSFYETVKKQYVFMIIIPIFMMFLIGQYIKTVIYGNAIVTDESKMAGYANHLHMFVIQLLGMASLFCIMFAYKKLLQNFCLSTELSLLEQEESFLNQYVEEAKARYEKTKSFRHDIKNHIIVIKELLQGGEGEQALNYMKDMESMAEELSFPYNTNNPVADILLGNKLGLAQGLGIDVSCSLSLPKPCGLRDIDLCIILSNGLDNAICACNKMEDSDKKYIRVTGRIQGDFILLEMENSFRGNGLFRKGTGLSNIKAAAEKYHGALHVKTEGTIFVLSVLLIIPQHS